MALSDIDRKLLERCLEGAPHAWDDFVDRFMGLVVHVVNHSAHCRSVRLSGTNQEDLVSEVFLAFLNDDHAILRRFRGQSSLATYLTVIARRVVVRRLLTDIGTGGMATLSDAAEQASQDHPERRIIDREEVEELLRRLEGQEAEAIRLFHMEEKSYREIGEALGMAENSVGPFLSRTRAKLRQGASIE